MADAIGNLFVSLGINTAQFEAGLNKARGSLDKFGKVSDAAMAAVSVAAAGAAVALGVAVKGAIDHADELSKAAQKAGVTTEALSRLEYAAKLSDVSLESLTGGLGKLGRIMVDVASGGAVGAKTAFEALGVSVTTATGALRDPNAVLADLADRFAQMEAGATKTALAVEIFGKSGADLIPLLNNGAAGLRAMGKESDALGRTISTSTGFAAEEFNDTLSRMGLTLDGVFLKIAEAALPALQEFADFLSSPQFAQAAETFGSTMVAVMNGVVQAIAGVTNAARDLFQYLSAGASNGFNGISDSDLEQRIANSERIIARRKASGQDLGNLESTLASEKAALASRQYMDPIGSNVSFNQLSAFGSPAEPFSTPDLPAIVANVGKVDEALKKSKEEMADWAVKMDQSVKDAAKAAEEAAQRFEQAWTGTTQLVTGALDALAGVIGSSTKESFEMSKKLSMASAIVAGIEASVQAFKKGNELGGLPLGLLWGGIAAATAAAKVAAIQSTSFNSTSMASGSTAGSASTSSSASSGAASQGLSIVLNGSADSKVSLGQVGELINQINDYLGTQGKQLVVNYKGA